MLQRSPQTAREPVFNLPPVIVGSVVVLLAIHAIRVYLLSDDWNGWVIAAFSFVPLRITMPGGVDFDWPGGIAGDVWTFVTYAFLHADWMHVGVNVLWLTAFGAPLARRFGTLRFIGFSLLGAAAGASAHLMLAPTDISPLVGASAAVSAQMAAAARFQFSPGGRLGGGGAFNPEADHRPALTIPEMIRNGRVMSFLLVWFAFNFVFGLLFFTPDLATMIADDRARAEAAGDMPLLDGDPFLNAQDWEIKRLSIKVDHGAAGKATGHVRFTNGGVPVAIDLMLVQTAKGWRIRDIHYAESTLRGLYTH